MKLIIRIAFISFTLFTIQSKAQDTSAIKMEVKESWEKMSQGNKNCLEVFIPGASSKDVERELNHRFKDLGAKGTQSHGEYFFDNVNLKSVRETPVDVYAKTNEENDGVTLQMFFDTGDGVFLDSKDGGSYKSAEAFVRDFAIGQEVAVIATQVSAQQKILDRMNRDHQQMVQQDSSLQLKIRTCEATIAQAKKDVATNELNQQNKKKEIEGQSQIIDALNRKKAGIK